MSKIERLLSNCETHDEWLELMRFGASYMAQQSPAWLFLQIQTEAKKELSKGVKSNEMFLIDHYLEQLEIKLVPVFNVAARRIAERESKEANQ